MRSGLLSLALLLLLLAGATPAPLAASAEHDPSTEIEEVHEVGHQAPPPSGIQLLGRMHPSLVHFPIGWLSLTFLLDLALYLLRKDWLRRASFVALGASALSFLPALGSGLLLGDELSKGEAMSSLMAWHRNLNLVVIALCWTAFLLRAWKKNDLQGWPRAGYLLLEMAAVAVLTVAGHLGGRMVFGPDYLPF